MPLPLIYSTSVTVPEALKGSRVNLGHAARLAIKFDGQAGAVDFLDRAGAAVEEPAALVGRRDLDAVAGGKLRAPMGRIQDQALPQLAPRELNPAEIGVELIHVGIGVGKTKRLLPGSALLSCAHCSTKAPRASFWVRVQVIAPLVS
jgi:hypothetical protein